MNSKDQIAKNYFVVKRRFEDTQFVYHLYTLLFLVAVFVLGYFGIYKSFTVLRQRQALIGDLKSINTSLQANIDTFQKLENDVLTTYNITKDISSFMPDTYSVEEYVLQLNGAIASSGFIMRRSTSYETSSDTLGSFLTLSVKVDGPGNPVDLVKNIEKLKRITKITAVNYTLNTHSSVKGDGDATLELEIFKTQKHE